jgi:hypothetical protein
LVGESAWAEKRSCKIVFLLADNIKSGARVLPDVCRLVKLKGYIRISQKFGVFRVCRSVSSVFETCLQSRYHWNSSFFHVAT